MPGQIRGRAETGASSSEQQVDDITDRFATYEDYLDSLITPSDLQYLGSQDTARHLKEHGDANAIRREEFLEHRAAAEQSRRDRLRGVQPSPQATCDLTARPLLKALAEREERVRDGALATVIFLRSRNAKGQEVSGYIDYGHRLARGDMAATMSGTETLLPRPNDLSYYNWVTQSANTTSSITFEVLIDPLDGLCFKHRSDRKVVCVNPKVSDPGSQSIRLELDDPAHLQVVLFDHVTRVPPPEAAHNAQL